MVLLTDLDPDQIKEFEKSKRKTKNVATKKKEKK